MRGRRTHAGSRCSVGKTLPELPSSCKRRLLVKLGQIAGRFSRAGCRPTLSGSPRRRMKTSAWRSLSVVRAGVRFRTDNLDHLQECADVAARHAARDGVLERREVAAHASGDGAASRRRRDDERAPVGFADRTRDEPAFDEAIQDARQRRSLVCEALVQLGNRRRRFRRQQGKDVRFALREAVVTEMGEV